MSKNKKLLFSLTKKDFVIETMRGHGKGGQHRNTTDSAVRITHPESGAVGYSEDERSQHRNKRVALKRLVESKKFQIWRQRKCFELLGRIKTKEQIEKEVEDLLKQDMQNGNVKIERYDKEKNSWIEVDKKNNE